MLQSLKLHTPQINDNQAFEIKICTLKSLDFCQALEGKMIIDLDVPNVEKIRYFEGVLMDVNYISKPCKHLDKAFIRLHPDNMGGCLPSLTRSIQHVKKLKLQIPTLLVSYVLYAM